MMRSSEEGELKRVVALPSFKPIPHTTLRYSTMMMSILCVPLREPEVLTTHVHSDI